MKEKDKIKLLERFKWVVEEGYLFPNPTDGDYTHHFVSVEDAFKVIKKGTKMYAYYEGDEGIDNIDDAFDRLLDEEYNTLEKEHPELYEDI